MPTVKPIADGRQVASYMIVDGTHARDWTGTTSAGRKQRFTPFIMLTLEDVMIVEKRVHFDRADNPQQLAG